MVIFNSYVKLPEGIGYLYVSVYPEGAPNQILDPQKEAPVPAGP